jgi:hypothetical protein
MRPSAFSLHAALHHRQSPGFIRYCRAALFFAPSATQIFAMGRQSETNGQQINRKSVNRNFALHNKHLLLNRGCADA